MFKSLLERVLGRRDDDEPTMVQDSNAAMNAAKAEARATLPLFWSKFETGEADEYQLKAGLTTIGGGIEHLWFAPQGWEEGKVRARLLNAPIDLDDLAEGDEVLLDPERISDWGYFKGGKLFGAFTQRVMLPQSNRELRRQLEAVLAPTPLEPEA